MTKEIRCRQGRCFDPEITLKKKMTLIFSGNSESDQIAKELLERELPDEE